MAETIPVKHLIYGRVEAEYSPKRRSGYQIVYHSSGLDSDIPEIEKRVQCFQYSGQEVERYQYFWTSSGRAVLSRTAPIFASDENVIDRNRRPGAFVTHGYIIDKDIFQRVRNDPFALFGDRNLFQYANEETFIAHAGQWAANPPPAQISVRLRTQYLESDPEWIKEEIYKLYQLTEMASTLTAQKQSLLFLGDCDEIYTLLSLTLFLVAPNQRAACTFDTFVDGCLPAPGQYWAVGGTKRQANSNLIPVYTEERRVDYKTSIQKNSEPSPKESHYSDWLRYSLKTSGMLSEVVANIYSVQDIENAYAAGLSLSSEYDNLFALRGFVNIAQASFNERLLSLLVESVEKPLAMFFSPVAHTYMDLPILFNAVSTRKFEVKHLAEAIYRWLLADRPKIRNWKPLIKLAEEAHHVRLLLVAGVQNEYHGILGLIWRKGDERKRALIELQNTEHLRDAMDELYMTWLQPEDFIIPSTIEPTMLHTKAYFEEHVLDEEVFQAVVIAVLKTGGGLYLTHLVEFIGKLTKKSTLKILSKEIEKHDVDIVFAQQVHARFNEL